MEHKFEHQQTNHEMPRSLRGILSINQQCCTVWGRRSTVDPCIMKRRRQMNKHYSTMCITTQIKKKKLFGPEYKKKCGRNK